jgi:hypothetical protein
VGTFYRGSFISLFAIGLALPASPQYTLQLVQAIPSAVILPSNEPAALTGKERLGRKWMDEQRIDNCNVPIDKRGTKPRPNTCLHVRQDDQSTYPLRHKKTMP